MHPTPPPRLSTLDRGLPLWIIAAMALGLALGHFTPGFADFLNHWKVGEVSLPIALGLEVPRFLFLGLCLNFHYFSTGVVFPKLGFDFSRRAVAQALVEP